MGLNIRKTGPCTWFLDVRARKAGQELRKRETFTGTRIQAAERFIQLKTEFQEGRSVVLPKRMELFRDFLEHYREKSQTFSEPHRYRYGQLMQALGEVPIAQLPDQLEKFLQKLRTEPSPTTNKPLTGATLNRLMAMVMAVFNLAVRLDVVPKNPISRARFPKFKEVARDKVLAPDEQGRLLSILSEEAPHLYPMVKYALQVPCRRSELLNMRKEDLDLIGNCIRVRNGTTKNDMGVWKPIPPDMTEYFRTLPTDCPYLFYRVEPDGYHRLGDFKTAWLRCLRKAGIQNLRFHDTRHISATNLLDSGTPEQVVLQVAGWKTNMLRTYYHRDGKKALGLVRFGSGSGHKVDTSLNVNRRLG